MATYRLALLVLSTLLSFVLSNPLTERKHAPATCKKTKVAVLGAGVAGLTAAVSRMDF